MPHKHRDVIVAWADGATIECRYHQAEWQTMSATPTWDYEYEYRVKPEKVYPKTRMMRSDIYENQKLVGVECAALEWLANAALRHAIDAGQLVDPSTYMADVRDLAGKRNARRDMAIAETVLAHCCGIARGFGVILATNDQDGLAAIIATVKD